MASTSTPVRKRKLLGNADTSFTNRSILQDDETERQERRKSLAPQPVNVNTNEVRSHLELCQKMFIENKITPKNAWNLRIIDYFTVMINTQNFDKEPLQAAASALEICTKVYACRVDDLHAEGMKLANSLATQREKASEENMDNNDEGGSAKKKKKKRKPRLELNSERYISTDMDSMLGLIPQLPNVPFNVQMIGDPEQTINLFTLTVSFDQYYHPHLRDKKNESFLSRDHADKVNEEAIEKFIPKVESFKICEEFENFEVNLIETDFNNSAQSLSSPVVRNTEAANQTVYDATGQPIVELDGSIRDIFIEETDEPVLGEELMEGCHREYHEVQIVSFCPDQEVSKQCPAGSVVGVNRSSYNDMSEWVNKMWIGPNHWKNKSLKRSMQRYSGISNKIIRTKKGKTLEKGPIDFFINVPTINFTLKVKHVKKIIDESKYLLPRNYLKRGCSDQSLMLMNYDLSKGYYAGNLQASEEEFEHQCPDYNFNNLNDSQYCLISSNGGDNAIDDLIEEDPIELIPQTLEEQEEANESAQQNHSCGFNISLDAIVCNDAVLQIPYAMQSKKVNMKQTKGVISDILRKHKVLSENVDKIPDNIRSLMFLNVYKELKTDLPKTSAQEMSIPIAFFALLHLTNEKSLTLKVTEKYNDVIITNEIAPHLRN